MYYIEYKNILYLVITKDTSKVVITNIKKRLDTIWNNKYKKLVVNAENSIYPIPHDFLNLVSYAKEKNISLIFE